MELGFTCFFWKITWVIMASQPTPSPNVGKKGFLAGLVKGNKWLISPFFKALFLGGSLWGGWLTSHDDSSVFHLICCAFPTEPGFPTHRSEWSRSSPWLHLQQIYQAPESASKNGWLEDNFQISRWWQLKHFLISPQSGEGSHFD